MLSIRRLAFGLAALTLSGCGNYAAEQRIADAGRLADNSIAFQNAQQGYAGGGPGVPSPYEHAHQQFLAEYNSCKSRLGDSRFPQIKTRIVTDGQPTLAHLADTQHPTAVDRALLLEWGTLVDECRSKGFAPDSGFSVEQFQIALASLISGEITYAAYNRRIAELNAVRPGSAWF